MATRSDLANAIRALAMDAVQKANSGHPGAPMGMAEISEVLWNHHLRHNPANPKWPDRDRFVLSNGHGSMLIYALLHLTGYDVTTDDLKNFRQLHSRTPGHPEYGYTPGVETTTGPLGQGITNAVGMALAEKLMAHEFNKPGLDIVNHHTYVFLGDGCMMEGISHEACALAGTWKLNKLVAFWASLLYNAWLSDVETCLKLAPTELWRDIEFKASGFGIEAEVTGAHRDRGCGMRFIGLSRAQRVRLADYLLRCWA